METSLRSQVAVSEEAANTDVSSNYIFFLTRKSIPNYVF
jgi:hypothetical protein